MKLLLGLTLLLATSSPARAADWYVDAVNGSDSNSGTSAADAWRTITHATQQFPATGSPSLETVHVAPGTHDAAHGEVFPIRLPKDVRLVGVQGSGQTFLVGDGGDVVEYHVAYTQGVDRPHPETGVSGFTLRTSAPSSGARALDIEADAAPIVGTFRDLVIEDVAMAVDCDIEWFLLQGDRLTFEGVEVRGADLDFYAEEDLTVQIIDSLFVGSEITAENWSEAYLTFNLIRSVVQGAPQDAIDVGRNGSGQVRVNILDSLIADSGRDGLTSYSTILRVVGSTIANNGRTGIEHQPFHAQVEEITGSIVYGNLDDLHLQPVIPVSNCNIGDGGPPVGQNGNISVDPLFRDPEHGDYRLGWGTGCVDAIPGLVTADLTGRPRGNDGDLDLVGAGDMGALELRTLEMPATLAIGQKLHVDYHAEIGQFATLFLARTTQLPTPLATPFGEQWLPTGFLENLGMQKSLTPHPVRRTLFIPNTPALVGQSFSFQALSRSSSAPQGAAWTDAATVTFTL